MAIDVKQYRNHIVLYEKCVCCGCNTCVPVNLHINSRYYYVEDAGQLCADCYARIYATD